MSIGRKIFVIQKHAAKSLHYDFRLEFGGKLISWAIPKGPSLNPREKRLAVFTIPHDLDYAEFEGIIPEGEYGAGIVMVWDKGYYKNIKQKDGKKIPFRQCIKNGHIEVWLEGKKLKGGFALIKMKNSDKHWLFIKMKDQMADSSIDIEKAMPNSAITGRSLNQIEKESELSNEEKNKN